MPNRHQAFSWSNVDRVPWSLYPSPGPRFNIKMSSYQNRKSHCGDTTVVRSSYLHNGISYTGKMSSLYWIWAQVSIGHVHGSLARYVKLRVAHALGMPGTFSPPPRVSDPDMHDGTYVSHVPWCMPGSLTSSFLCQWRGKHSRDSRRMRNRQNNALWPMLPML